MTALFIKQTKEQKLISPIMFIHTIITSSLKFVLKNWSRSIENNGAFPIIKYTARSEDGVAQIYYGTITHNFPTVFTTVASIINCSAGSEILVIGDNVHFPVGLDTMSDPLVNPRAEGLNGN